MPWIAEATHQGIQQHLPVGVDHTDLDHLRIVAQAGRLCV